MKNKYCISCCKIVLATIFLCFLNTQVIAQACPTTVKNAWQWPTHSNWFYGDGNIINFPGGTGAPTAINVKPGGFVSPAVGSYEGTTAISNDQGVLQYFANGRVLWTSTAAVKSTALLTGNEKNGGPGTPAGSTGSATQGVMSVRHPLNPDVVYIFTTDDALTNNTNLGFNYFTINTKTGAFAGPTRLGNYRSTEQLDATMHANGVDVWIVTRQSGLNSKQDFRKFNAYLLTCTGLNSTPVTSVAGPTVDGTYAYDWDRGGLKISWDGKRLVAVNHVLAWDDFGDAMTVYDFDNATGLLSNVKAFSGVWGGWSWNGTTYPDCYDVEFSPNSNAVFVSMIGSNLHWFDVSQASGPAIYATRKSITLPGGYSGAASLQMGGDGKLYLANLGQKNIIRFAGNLDAGTGITNSTLATPNNGQRGLSSFYLPPADEPDIQEVGPFCNTDAPVNLNTLWLCKGTNAESSSAPASYYSGPGITDAAAGIFSPLAAGEGTHQIIFTKCSVDDTIWITVNKCNTTCPDTTLKNIAPICVGSTVDLSLQKITIENGVWTIQGTGANYPTLVGNIFTTTATTAAGNYTVRYTLSPDPGAACPKYAERIIKVNAKPILTFNTTPVCEGSAVINFTATPSGGTFAPATLNPTTAGSTPVTYSYTDANSCSNTITTNQVVNAKPTLTFNTTPVCEGSAVINFTATPNGGTFAPATLNPTTAGSTPVTYSYTDANSCSNTITTNQVVNAKPILTFNTTPVCEGSAVINFTATPSGGAFAPASLNPTTAGSTPVTYSYTDANSCSNTITTNQVVNAKPILTFNTTPVCEGSALINFTATPSGGTFAPATLNPTTAGSTPVKYSYTDANSCSNTITTNQVVNAKPTLTFNTTPVCEGSAVINFTATPSGGTFAPATLNPTTAGSTPITYSYTDANSCSNTITTNQVVNAKPILTFNTTPVCEGSAVINFTATPSGGTFAPATLNPTTAGSTAVTYSYTDANSCSNTITTNQVVNAKPILTFNTTPVCEGSAVVNFTATPSGGTFAPATLNPTTAGSTPVTYSYTDANSCSNTITTNQVVNAKPILTFNTTPVCEGSAVINFTATPSGGTFAPVTLNPTTAGSTPVTYSYTDANSCSNTITTNQIVNAKPILTFNTTPVCEGSAVINFTASPSGGTFAPATLNPTTAGSTPVTYSYTDANSCSNTITTNQVVNAKPSITFSTTELCEGDAAITFNGSPAGGVYTGTGITGNTFTPSAAGSTAVTYTYTDANGCINAAAANQVVNAKPTLNLLDQSICPGSSTTLDAGAGFVSYAWTPTGESTQQISVNSGNTYGVTVTNAKGCKTSDNIVVTVNANLNIDLGLDKNICDGESATFTVNYGGTGVEYTWSGGQNTKEINVNTSGTYHVDVVDVMGCSGSDDVQLTVNALPTPTLLDAEICEGASHIFDAGNYSSYLWLSGETSKTITKTQSGLYTVTVTDANGCKADASANLAVSNNPVVSLGADYSGCGGTTATFDAGNAGANYLWSNNATAQSINVTTNGTYSVTVTDAKGCKGNASVKATFIEIPQLEIGEDADICEGESVTVNAVVSPASSTVTWSTGASGLSTTANSGRVIATANNGGLCSVKDTMDIWVHEAPKTESIPDQTLCFLNVANSTLDATASAAEYLWSTGETSKEIIVQKGGTYTVDLISEFGCVSTEKINVIEKCESSLFVPNAFTPNEDGKNEIFYVEGENIYDFELWIFDRWGEVIYHSLDMKEGWNGKRNNNMRDAQIDVYVWKVKYRFWEDRANNKPLREGVGTVTLVK